MAKTNIYRNNEQEYTRADKETGTTKNKTPQKTTSKKQNKTPLTKSCKQPQNVSYRLNNI